MSLPVWRDLGPRERRLVTIGAPIVVVLALWATLRRGAGAGGDRDTSPPVALLPPVAAPNDDAVGHGQLAAFWSMFSDELGAMTAQQAATAAELAEAHDKHREQLAAAQTTHQTTLEAQLAAQRAALEAQQKAATSGLQGAIEALRAKVAGMGQSAPGDAGGGQPQPAPPAVATFGRVSYVVDNQDAHWIADFRALVRRRVTASRRAAARARYGPPLTRKSQLAGWAAQQQDDCWRRQGRQPIAGISVWGACGWQQHSDW